MVTKIGIFVIFAFSETILPIQFQNIDYLDAPIISQGGQKMPISPRTKRTILNSHALLLTNSNFTKRRRSNIQKKRIGLIDNTVDLDGCTIESRVASSTLA